MTALEPQPKQTLSPEHPFAGLRPFGAGDCDFYFGREEQIYALYRILERSRFIAVVGTSGSGKSSLVAAGLLPLLEQESRNPGGRNWAVAVMHPGGAPIRALAHAVSEFGATDVTTSKNFEDMRRGRTEQLMRRSSLGLSRAVRELRELDGKAILLVVDQFEEIFRYAVPRQREGAIGETRWRDETVNFVQLILEAIRDRSAAIYALITMRSDFIGDCAQFYGLPEAVSSAQFLVPNLTRRQREEVIQKPIVAAGSTIAPELVERMLNDLSSDIDQLPVLQHALSRLWEQTPVIAGNERHPSLAQYQEIGGLRGALSQHAEQVMASLPGMELAIEQVFRALSETDREGRATRRAVPFRRLVDETGVPEADVRSILDRFRAYDCSFVVPSSSAVPRLTDDTRIDVVHEALLRNWSRIGREGENVLGQSIGWLEAEAADGRYYRALRALLEAASYPDRVTLPLELVSERWDWWRSRPRTEAWAERYGGNLTSVQALFQRSLAALQAKKEREKAEERRRREFLDNSARIASIRQDRARWLAIGAQALVLAFCAAVFIFAVVLVRNDRRIQTSISQKSALIQSNLKELRNLRRSLKAHAVRSPIPQR